MKIERTSEREWLLRDGAQPLAFVRFFNGIWWVHGISPDAEPVGFRRMSDALAAIDPAWIERERRDQARPIYARGALIRRKLRRD
jgi:hypothetical protein